MIVNHIIAFGTCGWYDPEDGSKIFFLHDGCQRYQAVLDNTLCTVFVLLVMTELKKRTAFEQVLLGLTVAMAGIFMATGLAGSDFVRSLSQALLQEWQELRQENVTLRLDAGI
jgi:hypothetical protein